MTKPRVLLLGAGGLFGGLLAERLLSDGRFEVVGAGRSESAPTVLASAENGQYVRFDRGDDIAVKRILSEVKPFAVVDCAGPFQAYGQDRYSFARAALKAGAHYLDIADSAEFVGGFSELDRLAKVAGLVALSGASSTPAISSTAVDELSQGLASIESIDVAIVPGNRARRTMSVMRAILGQIGKPFVLRKHRSRCNCLWLARYSWHQSGCGWKTLHSKPVGILCKYP